MKLYEEFADRRREFEILAFHDTRAESLADLDSKLQSVKSSAWGGKDLPFPILLDSTGKTLKMFGISAFPTIVLIDPKGRVVQGGGEHTLREHLMGTSPTVQKILKQLEKSRSKRSLDKALQAIVKHGGDQAAFALKKYAEEEAKEKRIPAIFEALDRIGGDYAVSFFLGEKGLGSEDRKIAIASAKVLEKHATRDHLGSLVHRSRQIEDPEVKKALNETIRIVNEKRQ